MVSTAVNCNDDDDASAAPIATSTGSNDDAVPQQQVRSLLTILEALSLNHGSTSTMASSSRTPPMSHYRHVPASVKNAYQTMRHAATNIQATSLKYTLLRGEAVKQGETATTNTRSSHDEDLSVVGASFISDCHLLVKACTTLWDDTWGCAPSTKAHARRVTQTILTTVAQQLECCPLDPDYGAGAVEEICRYVTAKKFAVGNREVLRRDILTYVMDCRSTGTKFQQVIDHTSTANSTGETPSTVTDTSGNNSQGTNDDETYSTLEMPIAKACVAILLCSRWCLNASRAAMDAVGDMATASSTKVDDTTGISSHDRLCWMEQLHQLATATGVGVTGLGETLYPPMDVAAVQAEVERQTLAVQKTVGHILTYAANASITTTLAPTTNSADDDMKPASSTCVTAVEWYLPLEVTEVAQNVQKAIAKRKQQALDAIEAAAAAASVDLTTAADVSLAANPAA